MLTYGFLLRPTIHGWGSSFVRLGSGVGLPPGKSWLGCWGVCVCVRAPPVSRLSLLGCAVWSVCLGSGFGCAPPLLAGVLGSVCVCVRAPPVPRHSWLWRAVWVCVRGLGFWLRSATPGWRVGVCVCLCARSSLTPPILAGLCGMGVCAWVRFWLRSATPGWGVGVCVCFCGRSSCGPPILAGVCAVGVCAWAWVSPGPRHSWLGCCVLCVFVCAPVLNHGNPGWGVRCGCVLALGFRLRPATLAWVVGVCVCLCARSSCTPPLLAGMCGMGVCAWAWVWAAPRDSWLWCWGLCVFVCVLLLYPATPSWGMRCGCVCLARVSAAPRHSWLGRWGVRMFMCALLLYPATLGWGARCGCVCLGWVLGAPRLSWLRCWGL